MRRYLLGDFCTPGRDVRESRIGKPWDFSWNWTEDANDVIIWDTSRRTRISSFSFFGCTSWTWSCSLSAWFVVLASSTPLEEWAARRSSFMTATVVHGSPTGPSTCPSEHPKVQWFIFTSNIRDHQKLQVSLQFSTCFGWWWISRHIRAASVLVVLGTRLSASQLVESAAHHEDLDSLAAPVEDADRSRFCQSAIWSAKVFKI